MVWSYFPVPWLIITFQRGYLPETEKRSLCMAMFPPLCLYPHVTQNISTMICCKVAFCLHTRQLLSAGGMLGTKRWKKDMVTIDIYMCTEIKILSMVPVVVEIPSWFCRSCINCILDTYPFSLIWGICDGNNGHLFVFFQWKLAPVIQRVASGRYLEKLLRERERCGGCIHPEESLIGAVSGGQSRVTEVGCIHTG